MDCNNVNITLKVLRNLGQIYLIYYGKDLLLNSFHGFSILSVKVGHGLNYVRKVILAH